MLNLTREPAAAGTGVLKIAGEATVENAVELHRALITGLQEYQHLQLDCSGTTVADFFAVQLFCSAHRTGAARGRKLSFSGSVSPAVDDTLRRVGFYRPLGCSHCLDGGDCLWLNPGDHFQPLA